ncbi:MAG TPA: Wadjet anti-phage system protein JetD domain-containing protein [Anaeromyxobacteraceae bacterium]|nr:Wadjet anti-phage system protein JetD domain-containing protein [Anaeromyxobacteraceae bacterium]
MSCTERMDGWTKPEDVAAHVARRWNDGRLLAACLGGDPVFPLRVPVRGPRPAQLGARFDDVKQWLRTLEARSKAARGYGYELELQEVENRVVGVQRLPVAAVVPTEDDGLRLIRRSRDAERFKALADATLAAFPELRLRLLCRPLTVVEQADSWEQVLAVLAWFRDHPRPGIYLRQIDVPGVDTKFIERRRGLLAQLLDVILPPSAIDAAFTGAAGFEGRYGLRSRPSLVRFRILDPDLRIRGVSDLTVPVTELASLDLPARRFFVTENEVNGLAFPNVQGSVVVFGLGYGLDRLAALPWLSDRQVIYWGDLDTHGFAMLSKLRTVSPGAASILMDRETLLAHRSLWVREPEPHRGELPGLLEDERRLYEDLRDDRLGEAVRLEQERIAFGWVKSALYRLDALP